MSEITKPWHAMLVALTEQVIRGAKAIAELSVRDHDDRIREFCHELANETPAFCDTPIFDIRPTQQHDVYRVLIVSDTRLLSLYDETQAIQGHDTIKHALLGYMFGYDTQSILAFLGYRTPSKCST